MSDPISIKASILGPSFASVYLNLVAFEKLVATVVVNGVCTDSSAIIHARAAVGKLYEIMGNDVAPVLTSFQAAEAKTETAGDANPHKQQKEGIDDFLVNHVHPRLEIIANTLIGADAMKKQPEDFSNLPALHQTGLLLKALLMLSA